MVTLALLLDLAAATPAPVAPAVNYPHICEAPDVDLDGDGVIDPVDTVHGTCGTGGCSYVITIRPAGARRPISLQVDGCRFQRGTRRAHGIFDLVSLWRLGTDWEESRFHFDGKRFRRTRLNARR